MANNWTRKMPDGWMPGCCSICDIPCGREETGRQVCPLANAKPAVEVTTWEGVPKHNGKPVALLAVEIKGE